nr:unnamed protein product [Callosobruchus analis]
MVTNRTSIWNCQNFVAKKAFCFTASYLVLRISFSHVILPSLNPLKINGRRQYRAINKKQVNQSTKADFCYTVQKRVSTKLYALKLLKRDLEYADCFATAQITLITQSVYLKEGRNFKKKLYQTLTVTVLQF